VEGWRRGEIHVANFGSSGARKWLYRAVEVAVVVDVAAAEGAVDGASDAGTIEGASMKTVRVVTKCQGGLSSLNRAHSKQGKNIS
jgi:hypothetical protein